MNGGSFPKTPQELAFVRRACQLSARILREVADKVAEGATTRELNAYAAKRIEQEGMRSAFLGEGGFPAVLCASVNSMAVHGVPTDVRLYKGDILKLDFGLIVDGWYSDVAVTVPIGKISKSAQRLLEATREALEKGIAQAAAGKRVGDISAAIQRHVEAAGFEVIRELAGHGVGRTLHEPPQVQNFGKPDTGEFLRDGMILAIEPITSLSSQHVRLAKDSFGYETTDGSLSAHFEHTVLITKKGPEILTSL